MSQSKTNYLNNVSTLKLLVTLMIGIAIGFTFSQMLNTSQYEIPNISTSIRYSERSSPIQMLSSDVVLPADVKDTITIDLNNNQQQNNTIYLNINGFNTSIAEQLYGEVRILCWILTNPKNHATKAMHVKYTWGSRCNKLLFMSSTEDADLGTVKLNVAEGRANLWRKTREAFKFIYDHYLDDYDWFVKADDDTYMIVENLRLFLYPMSSDAPVYFGCRFKPHVRQGYMSGGAGYVLSRTAVRRFIELAYPNKTICRQSQGGAEDQEMGKCLQNVGVIAGDSRDEQQRGRFFPSAPDGHIKPKPKSHWYWRYIYYATEEGRNCCSNYAISFHYIRPDHMYVLDYLIYTLRPFGVLPMSLELPHKNNMTELLNRWRIEMSDNPL